MIYNKNINTKRVKRGDKLMNEFLLKFRKEKKLTQEEFSDLLGITLTYYSKIELGLRNPSYNFLNKFKSAFPNASIDDIFFRHYAHEMCS